MILGRYSETFEQYFLQLIAGRRRGLGDKSLLVFLFVASRFYRMAVQFRIWLYDKRVIRNHSIGCLVVSIGNVSCGGTGKTPVVEVFAKSLRQKGRKVAILSRGYRSKKIPFWQKMLQRIRSEKMETPPKIVSDGTDLLLNSRYAGDEPYMLATNLKDVAVIVDKDRVKAGLYAIDKFETDTLILDDGFQYLSLKPHINIVLIDSTDPFGNHHVLPRGILREPIKNLRRADYIFLTKSDGGGHLKHLKNFLRRHNRRAEIIECCHKPRYLEKVYERGERAGLAFLRQKKIAAISAIACPESFEHFLGQLGGELVHSIRYTDHHRFSQQELIDFVNKSKAAGAEIIVTTEKDAVRMPHLNRYDLEFYFLRVEIDILSGRENFDQCISRICFL
ncbi:MAG: tetraacyldisaccharide 4'-kinase [Victivallaceae bacterium]|nr:tetraacyldisaccharide 4'-kinase [Victivallaceae bacterium]